MKAILLSIKPEWLVKILNGEKTIEVRKLFPKDYVGWVYLYCSKSKPNLWLPYEYDCFKLDELSQPYLSDKPIIDYDYKMNGKVVARFWCDKVEEIEPFEEVDSPMGLAYKLTEEKIINCQKAQLTYDEYAHYLKGKNGFAIHISKLEIFDKPRELSEFYTTKLDEDLTKRFDNSIQLENGTWVKPLTKAPQNFCYVEEE